MTLHVFSTVAAFEVCAPYRYKLNKAYRKVCDKYADTEKNTDAEALTELLHAKVTDYGSKSSYDFNRFSVKL